MNREKLLREIIRLLMAQVREEQIAREEVLKVWLGKHKIAPIPTDHEVNAKIQELEEEAQKNLTKNEKGGKVV